MRLSPLEAHRIWSESYDADPNPMLALEARVLSPALGDLCGSVFLDAACGTGRWLEQARARGAAAWGVDLSGEMLRQARHKPGLAGTLARADAGALPFADGIADVVLCAFSLAYLEPLEPALAELARAVKPGGQLIATDLHPDGYRRGWTRSFSSGGQAYEIEHHPYTKEQWLAAGRGAGLELIELREPRFEGPEREIFRRAGKEHLFEETREIPAVLIVRWRRPP